MCQYDTQAAIPAMMAVAINRIAARYRRCTGTREISSTVSSRASGGQAAMAWLIGLSRACRTLATTEAATPSSSVARTAQRTRRSCSRITGPSSDECRRAFGANAGPILTARYDAIASGTGTVTGPFRRRCDYVIVSGGVSA